MSTPEFPPLPDDITRNELTDLANRLNSSTIHFLRFLRRASNVSDLSASRLSLLFLLVFGGPQRLTEIAIREQISKPSASRMVRMLEADGLAVRSPDPKDGRVVVVEATPVGIAAVETSRSRRIQVLAEQLRTLDPETLRALSTAADCLEMIFWSPDKRQTSS